MELTANMTWRRSTLAASASAAFGAAAWLLVPLLPVGSRLAPGSLEHMFLLVPLVTTPLALALVARLRTDDREATDSLLGLARLLQPAAAALLLASFLLPAGRAAGALCVPWLLLAGALVLSGVARPSSRLGAPALPASLVAAPIFLVVGAAWLLAWRLGVGPRSMPPLLVLLATVHFHANGFAAQVLVGATAARAATLSLALRRLQHAVVITSLAGLPLLAAGKALALPVARAAGNGATTLAMLGLAVTTIEVARGARTGWTRGLLAVSAASSAAAAALAAAFGAGELVHQEWIGIGTMTTAHGALMGVGFTLCGVAGHLRLQHA
jgi:hypothetical protein